MTRRELREHVFKILFGVEFHDVSELSQQIAVYGETEGAWDVADGEYITKKCTDIVEHLEEIDAAINEVSEGWKRVREWVR